MDSHEVNVLGSPGCLLLCVWHNRGVNGISVFVLFSDLIFMSSKMFIDIGIGCWRHLNIPRLQTYGFEIQSLDFGKDDIFAIFH